MTLSLIVQSGGDEGIELTQHFRRPLLGALFEFGPRGQIARLENRDQMEMRVLDFKAHRIERDPGRLVNLLERSREALDRGEKLSINSGGIE